MKTQRRLGSLRKTKVQNTIVILSRTIPYTKLSAGDLKLTKFLKTTVGKVKAVKRAQQSDIAVE